MLDQATLLDLLSNFQHQINTQASELAVQLQAGEEKAEKNKERLRVIEILIADCQKGMMEFGSRIDACSTWSMDSEQQFHESLERREIRSKICVLSTSEQPNN